MFRPLKLLNRNAVKMISANSTRTKIIYSESFLDKAERMKLWHQENKLLYGSTLETNKAKEKRVSPKDKRRPAHKTSKCGTARIAYQNANTEKLKLKQKINLLCDIDSQGYVKENEVICIENKIPKDAAFKKSEFFPISNLLTACNKLGKHQVEIITPNVKNGILAPTQNAVPSIIIRNLKLFPMMNRQNINAVGQSEDSIEEKILTVVPGSTDIKNFPSVTKILDYTMSPESREGLEKWKQEKISELGEEGFQQFNKQKLDSGKEFHEVLSHHFLTPQAPPIINPSVEGAWESVKPLLKNIIGPKAIESHVVHPVLKYRGVIDCIAMYQDKPTLIEWKKSDNPKHALSATFDNPIQLAAYFGAISHDPNYKALNVRDALLVISYSNGETADFFHLNTDQMRIHWATWLTRLERFWTENKKQEAKLEEAKVEQTKLNGNK